MRRKRVVVTEERKTFSAVTEVPIETRGLITIGLSRSNLKLTEAYFGSAFQVEGAIVWVKPDPDLSLEELRAFEAHLKSLGIARVKFIPPEKQDKEVPDSVHTEASKPNATVREVVGELVGELPNEVREEARGIAEECLNEAGV